MKPSVTCVRCGKRTKNASRRDEGWVCHVCLSPSSIPIRTDPSVAPGTVELRDGEKLVARVTLEGLPAGTVELREGDRLVTKVTVTGLPDDVVVGAGGYLRAPIPADSWKVIE